MADNEPRLEEIKEQKLEEQKSENPEEKVDCEMTSTEQKFEDAASTEETWDILMDPTGEDETVTEDDIAPRGWRGRDLKKCSDNYTDPRERDRDLKKYYQQFFSSNGFEVDSFPNLRGLCGKTVPIHDADTNEQILELSEFAIGTYNETKGTHYKLVGVTKATRYLCAGYVYNITFKAEDAVAGINNTFRASVYVKIDRSRECLSCDIHPKPKLETSSSKVDISKKGCEKKGCQSRI